MTFWEYMDRWGDRMSKEKRLLANVIGVALISGFLGALFALFVIPIPKANEQIVIYMVGQLSGFAGGIVAYHYTLTAGSREQEVHRAELENKRVQNTASAFEAVKAVVSASAPEGVKPDVILKAGETAQAEEPS